MSAPESRVTITGVDIDGLRATRPRSRHADSQWGDRQALRPGAAEAGRERLLQLGLFRQVAAGSRRQPNWKRATAIKSKNCAITSSKA